MDDYTISTDPNCLDTEFIVASLQTTYWAGERQRSVILQSWGRSLCFGVYSASSGKQVGFARVVTDGATFSWLCDVFVDPNHRRKGLGKRLVEAVLAHADVSGRPVYLGTKDAHGLYEKYGFQRWELMRRSADPTGMPRSGA